MKLSKTIIPLVGLLAKTLASPATTLSPILTSVPSAHRHPAGYLSLNTTHLTSLSPTGTTLFSRPLTAHEQALIETLESQGEEALKAVLLRRGRGDVGEKRIVEKPGGCEGRNETREGGEYQGGKDEEGGNLDMGDDEEEDEGKGGRCKLEAVCYDNSGCGGRECGSCTRVGWFPIMFCM